MLNRFDYIEREEAGNSYRTEYYNGVNKLILKKQEEANETRKEFARNIIAKPEEYRQEFIKMLGWPLTEERKPYLSVKETFVTSEENCDIYRVQIEVFEDFWFYGMLFKQRTEKQVPTVIVQHGGLGTPELVAGFSSLSNYNFAIKRVADKGVNVFAPQLLLWEEEKRGPKTQRQHIDDSLRQLGGSITALEIYCIQSSINWLIDKEYADDRIAMMGLSYGGFYTMYTAAVDKRIKAAFSSSQFNNRYIYNWTDWAFKNAANTFFDAEIGALIFPRPFYIEVGDKDLLFDSVFAEEEFKKLKEFYAGNPQNLKFKVFDGGHEFSENIEEGIDFILSAL